MHVRSLSGALLLLAVVGGAAAAPAPGGTRQPQVQLQGRFWPGSSNGGLAGLPQWMSWPSSTAAVSWEGSGSVTVVLDGSAQSYPDKWLPDLRGRLVAYFQFVLDGRPAGVVEVKSSQRSVTWRKTGLGNGRHNLRISKISEARTGCAWLRSITLAPAGRFLAPPPTDGDRTGRRVLFIGDSLTAGAGNIGDKGCRLLAADNQNSLLSFAPVTARALRADFQALAWSGATVGIYRLKDEPSWTLQQQHSWQPRMRDLLARADALGPKSRYNMSAFVPQVVVLGAGVNDFAEADLSGDYKVVSGALARLPSMDRWAQEHVALAKQVRAAYPGAAIVTLAWPLEINLAGLRSWQSQAVYAQWVAAAASRLQEAGLKNTYFLQLNGEMVRNDNYCKDHPDVKTHQAMAAQLERFIRGALPSFVS